MVLFLGASTIAAVQPAVASAVVPTDVPLPSTDTAAFSAIAPVRLADTREAECGCTVLDAHTIRVVVAGRDGIAADISAAALTITATSTPGQGYVTVYPSGTQRPNTSTLNLPGGAATSNSTIIPVGDGGAVDVYSTSPTGLIVDATGTFTDAASATTGRFVPVAAARILNTRGGAPLPVNGSVTVPLPVGVDLDAVAVAVNVTSVSAFTRGFVSGYAAGAEAVATSFMNPDGTGRARAAAVILPVSADGFTIDTTTGGHLIVDLVGWFTGPSAVDSTDGLLVALTPTRLLDTRVDLPHTFAWGTRELPLPVSPIAAVVTNLTMVAPDTAGYVTAYPAGTALPSTSSVNAPFRNSVVPNLAITPVSDRGTAYFSSHGTDLIIDLTGYFTGTPATAALPVPPNPAPVPRVLMVGDSTLYGLTEVPRTQQAFRGFTPVLEAKPCRRLVSTSCKSRFTLQIPTTALVAIEAAPGTFDAVVIKTGYNDSATTLERDVRKIVDASRAKGAKIIIWMTYSESTKPGWYDNHNAILRRLAGSAAYPDLVVADWRAFASKSATWYASDRLHLTTLGNWATADYLSRWIASLSHLPCPMPWTVGGSINNPCPNPDAVAAFTGTVPGLKALYGF